MNRLTEIVLQKLDLVVDGLLSSIDKKIKKLVDAQGLNASYSKALSDQPIYVILILVSTLSFVGLMLYGTGISITELLSKFDFSSISKLADGPHFDQSLNWIQTYFEKIWLVLKIIVFLPIALVLLIIFVFGGSS